MSNILSFTAACRQLGNAGQQFVLATWRAPFTGGWTRMVVVGTPVLFITAGSGAAIFYIMNTVLRGAGRKGSEGLSAIYKFYHRPKVVPFKPQPQPNEPIPEKKNENPISQKSNQSSLIIKQPLPIDAAKERNASLIQLLDLVEKYVIEPWIVKNDKLLEKAAKINDPFLNAMLRDPNGLKSWLQSMALCRLGMVWDQIENQYVQMKTPPPPTIESIQEQVKAQNLDDTLEKNLLTTLENKNIAGFQEAVTKSSCSNSVKLTLMNLSFQLNILLSEARVNEKEKQNEQKEMLKTFALTMNHGVATTLNQMTLIIEGWFKVMEHISPSSNRLTWSQLLPSNPQQKNENLDVSNFDNLVLKISKIVTGQLSEKYLQPLWDKKQSAWKKDLEEELSKIENKEVINDFLNGKIDEKTFLTNQSYSLSTALTSHLSFIRAMNGLNGKNQLLKESMHETPFYLMTQIEPTLNMGLNKLAEMISQISFERTIPKLVSYFQALLHCCTAMQKVRDNYDQSILYASQIINPINQAHPLEGALIKGKIDAQKAKGIANLCNDRERQISGRDIVKQLGTSMHKTIRVGQAHSKVQEETWVRVTKERLKGVFRLRIAEYTKDHWLFALFEKVSSGISLNLFPGMESMAKILALGVQTFIEEEGTIAIQQNLNTLTSTTFISETLSVSIVSGLIESNKEDDKWKTNLSMLRWTYAYLGDQEQEQVKRHLSFQFPDHEIYEARLKDLTQMPTDNKDLLDSIRSMKDQEKKFDEALEQIAEARHHFKNPNDDDKKAIAKLEEGYGKLKRERDLKKFARVKNLVLYVANEGLNEPLNFAGGENLKKIILAVIQEVLTLFTYQELVKHWFFTLVDLIVDELEEKNETENLKEASHLGEETPSLLDFIKPQQKQELLPQLTDLVSTSSKQNKAGWFNAQGWMTWGATQVSWLVPTTIWGYIGEAFKEPPRLTPKNLQDKLFEKVTEFGTDPSGLSALVIEALSENVADPRPERDKEIKI